MSNNRIFITGGASGLGKAIALKYAREGYAVCIADINDERGAKTEKELKAIATDAFYINCNVTKIEDFEAARDALVERWGGVDVIVNNAGVAGTHSAFEKISMEDWEWCMNINAMGSVRGCKVFTPLFKEQGGGHIINVASIAGLLCAPDMALYNMSKSAVVSLSETLSYELHDDNISVSVVCPAFFKTNLTESMRTNVEGMHNHVNNMMQDSGLTADDIAADIFEAHRKKKFYVISHRKERTVWWIKRLNQKVYSKIIRQAAKDMIPD